MNKPFAVSALCATVALAGCAPQTNMGGTTPANNQNRNTGAAMGAIAGGLLAGPVSDGNRREAAAGAAVGAVAGGLIGAQLDRQAAELRRDLGNSVTVSNEGDHLLVNFPQDILFDTDSTALGASSRAELSELAANLQRYPNSNIQIIGHTDNTGSANYNNDLSNRRARAVSSVLVNSGVSSSRVSAIGRGEDAPVASNLTAEGKAQNRRVEIIIRPSGTT